MPSHYQRLFKYRERPDRTPLEDFLTEALADLLNRLPDQLQRRFAERLLSNSADAIAALTKAWPIGARATWITQLLIDGGQIIDLLLEVEGRPLIVVESKIAAGFQLHNRGDADSGNEGRRHQLSTYGEWISRKSTDDWGGGLVLLTHWTPPPADYQTAQSIYRCLHRTTVRWSGIANWLRMVLASAGDLRTDWISLGWELLHFLREYNMESEVATQLDLAALQVYVSSADRVRNTVTQIWDSAEAIWKPLCQQADKTLAFEGSLGCVWKFRYLKRTDLRNCYISTGLRYPVLGGHPPESIGTDEPCLFVELAADYNGSPISGMEMPDNWLAKPDIRVSFLPLRSLPAEPNSFVAEASAWVGERFREASAFVA